MALTGDTGNLATLTLPGAYSVAIISINQGAAVLAPVDATVLATVTDQELIPGDIVVHGENTATFKWVGTVAKPTLGTVGTCTVTKPLTGALTNAATYSGTGMITSWKPPDLANGQLMVGEVKWVYDGDTGPTLTVAS